MNAAIGFIEIAAWSPAMVALDRMTKGSRIDLLQAELNDGPGVCLKIAGSVADVRHATNVAEAICSEMQVRFVVDVIPAPDPKAAAAHLPPPDYNALFEQATIHEPSESKERAMNQQADFAVGLIETQGFTAVFEAIDTAVKTANVEVLAREKLGGGYITVLIKGDVAAVTAAIEAGKAKVEGLGKLIAAHVIASPSQSVLSLLPKA